MKEQRNPYIKSQELKIHSVRLIKTHGFLIRMYCQWVRSTRKI